MIASETKIRIRYAETDKMGYCHHSHYAKFFEEGRTDLMRNIGISYLDMENRGVMLPVLELNTKFIKPAFYDEVLTVKTYLKEYPGVKIKFYYDTYNEAGELINQAVTTLAFVDARTMKPIRPPKFFLELLDELK